MSESMAAQQSNEVPAAEVTLYERLGRHDRIEAMARTIFNNHVNNPLISQRYAESDPEKVIRLVTEMMCAGFGGPESYTGRDMLAAHKGMNISEQEFIAVVDDVMDALAQHEVGQKEKDEILCILYSLKNDIVRV